MAKGDMQPTNSLAGSPFRSNMMGPPQAGAMGSIGGSFNSMNPPGMPQGQAGTQSMAYNGGNLPGSGPTNGTFAGQGVPQGGNVGPSPQIYQQLMQMLSGQLGGMNRMPLFRGMMPQPPNFGQQTMQNNAPPSAPPSGPSAAPRNRERNA